MLQHLLLCTSSNSDEILICYWTEICTHDGKSLSEKANFGFADAIIKCIQSQVSVAVVSAGLLSVFNFM